MRRTATPRSSSCPRLTTTDSSTCGQECGVLTRVLRRRSVAEVKRRPSFWLLKPSSRRARSIAFRANLDDHTVFLNITLCDGKSQAGHYKWNRCCCLSLFPSRCRVGLGHAISSFVVAVVVIVAERGPGRQMPRTVQAGAKVLFFTTSSCRRNNKATYRPLTLAAVQAAATNNSRSTATRPKHVHPN
jgi:hypothetical protein